MYSKEQITPQLLMDLLKYAPETGMLFWRPRHINHFRDVGGRCKEHISNYWHSRFSGEPAFTGTNGHGYLRGNLCGNFILAHRAIWAIATGSFPQNDIDHINSIRSDNRWCNLREATKSQNQKNRKGYAASGLKGVYWDDQKSMWKVIVSGNLTKRHVGYFLEISQAEQAYKQAAKRSHGEFLNIQHKEKNYAL
jgi:hypothetical protein